MTANSGSRMIRSRFDIKIYIGDRRINDKIQKAKKNVRLKAKRCWTFLMRFLHCSLLREAAVYTYFCRMSETVVKTDVAATVGGGVF